MEDKVRRLFDYQRFAKNRELQKIITDTQSRFDEAAVYLEDESLSLAYGGRHLEESVKDEKQGEDLNVEEKKDNLL